MYLAGFVFLLLATGHQAVEFLVMSNDSIIYFDESNTGSIQRLVKSISRSTAVDYHFKRNEIYFSDGLGQIKRTKLHPDSTSKVPNTIAEIRQSDGLAVDWVNENLYWTDVTQQTVEMSTLDGLYRRVLFNSTHGVEKPRGIALDPFQGLMFWIDSKTIESAGLDGKSKSSLVQTRLEWPNGISLDLNKKTVYILEASLGQLITYNYDGTNKKVFHSSQNYLLKASSLTFSGLKIYWIFNRTRTYYMRTDSNKKDIYRLLKTTANAYEMKAVDPSLQKDLTMTDPCKLEGCSHKCVYGRYMTPSCVCSYGFILQGDGKTCSEEGYLLLSWRGPIKRYSLQGTNNQFLYKSAPKATALAYHYKKQLVFWSTADHRIYRAPLEQLNNKTILVHTETCDGLAVDWVHDVLYWTDVGLRTLEAANLDGSKRRVIFSEHMDKPRDIALDPHKGYMFWTDWGAEAKIERAVLDGSERSTIINQQINWPNSLTIDFQQQRIYWVDGKLGTVSSSLYNGSNRKTVRGHKTKNLQFFGISLFNSEIYLTDWTFNSLVVIDKSLRSFQKKSLFTNSNPYLSPNVVKVVHSSLQRDQENPCTSSSCAGLCLGTKDPQKVQCFDSEVVKLLKTVKNDSIEISVNGDRPISLALISVQCVKRHGCLEDKRCTNHVEGYSFLNQSTFQISGLLPESEYSFTFESSQVSEKFQVNTENTYPPEIPRVTSVETLETSAIIKWTPVDSCVPGFNSYHYELIQKDSNGQIHPVGNTSDTQLVLNNLQKGTEYSVHIYTTDPSFFAEQTFKTKTDVVPVCMTGEFLCNGVQDCADGIDETPDICAAIDKFEVYSKNRTSVSLRVTVPEVTRKNMLGFAESSASGETRLLTPEACVFWPESYCFTVSSLLPETIYNFQIQVVLKNDSVGKVYKLSATTKEEAPGPVEGLIQIGSTNTSLELQWRHPNQSNGQVESFLVHIYHNESLEEGKCCQRMELYEIRKNIENFTLITYAQNLTPASTYLIEVAAVNLYVGEFFKIEAYTSPPPLSVGEPSVFLRANGESVTWKPQLNIDPRQTQFPQLTEYYLLLALTENVRFSTKTEMKNEVDIRPFQSLIEKTLAPYHVHVYETFHKDDERRDYLIAVDGLIAGYKYRLAWAQVSRYKEVYSVDYILSEELDFSRSNKT